MNEENYKYIQKVKYFTSRVYKNTLEARNRQISMKEFPDKESIAFFNIVNFISFQVRYISYRKQKVYMLIVLKTYVILGGQDANFSS